MTPNRFMRSLYSDAAQALCGRPVALFWEQPPHPYKFGCAGVEAGRAYIVLDPDLSKRQAYKVFLHEAAHLALDYDTYHKSGQRSESAGNGRQPSPLALAVVGLARGLMEVRANMLAGRWAIWADLRSSGPTVAERLLALQAWGGNQGSDKQRLA